MNKFYLQISKLLKTPWQHFFSASLIGICCGFYSYTLFFQTTVFSKRYLMFAIIVLSIGFLFSFFALQRHPFAQKNQFFLSKKSILIALALFGLASPSIFFIPPYPDLPFFQHLSSLTIELKTGDNSIDSSQFQRIWLKTGVEAAGFKKFTFSKNWISFEHDFVLPAHSIGRFNWQGHVGSRATLSLPVPVGILEMKTNWDGEIRQVLLSQSTYFQNKKFIPSLTYILLMNIFVIIPLFLVFVYLDHFSKLHFLVLMILMLGFSVFQVLLQFDALGREFNTTLADAISSIQLQRHNDVLTGVAAIPWQYRILSEWIIEFLLRIKGESDIESAIAIFRYLRIFQNVVIFILAYQYFSRLGVSKSTASYGVFLLAISMLHVFYDSDLSFNTYFDVIFYLIGVLIILDAHYAWLPVLMIFAALNRETSGIIPVLLIGFSISNVSMKKRREAFLYGSIGLLIWGIIFLSLHLFFLESPLYKIGGILSPGFEYIKYNLSIPQLPILLFQTVGILPLVGWFYRKNWHLFVRLSAIILIPVWLLFHFFTSVWAETRLFLVPLVIVIIPAVLPLINHFSYQLHPEIKSGKLTNKTLPG